jgi:hypothetical protein
MEDFYIGTLVHKNIRDSNVTFFVINCELSFFRRLMFSKGYDFISNKEVMRKGIPGLEVVLHGKVE